MSQVKIDKLTIRLRGVSAADARRAIARLGPALQSALAPMQGPIVQQSRVDVRVPRGHGALADRIAAPVAAALRGERKR